MTLQHQLLVLDVDGTLLDSDHQLRPRVAAAVRAVASHGLTVALATGKLLPSVLPLLETLGITGPQIVLNGAATLQSNDGSVLRFRPLMDAARRKVIELVQAADPGVLVSQFALDAIYVGAAQRAHPLLGVFAEYGEGPPLVVPHVLAETLPPAAKILLCGAPARLGALRAALAPWLPPGVVMTTTTPDFLEFFDERAGKGRALAALRGALSISREAVIAVGDGENDVPLLREAGLPIAMANGTLATRAAAARIAPSNDEEGVAVVLEELLASGEL
jgi:Cof subfamily protein (haloacid dehalogenase superfamily)